MSMSFFMAWLARLRGTSNLALADYLQGRALPAPRTFLATRFVLLSSRDSIGGGPYRIEETYALEPQPMAGDTAWMEQAAMAAY